MKSINYIKGKLLLLIAIVLVISACEEDADELQRTRLFSPVISESLKAEGNTILVTLGKSVGAIGYQLEVSLDTFQTIAYTIQTDTNFLIINSELVGEDLLWDTRYQLRAQAFANDSVYNSLVSDLGGIRTQKFPTNLNSPDQFLNDVTDVAVRLTWVRSGTAITSVKVFTTSDLRLQNPLAEFEVSEEEEAEGVKIVDGLTALTSYQIAIYSNGELKGWNTYTTRAFKANKASSTVIDLSTSDDATAVSTAYASANDGDTILMKKGVTYDFPSTNADKSITFMGDHGFVEAQAKFYTTGNWNVAEGSMIDHIRFIDVELQGEDPGGDYVMNPSGFVTETRINELTFDNCVINSFRGVMRIRNTMFIDNYNIINSVVHTIGGYGIITCDTDGEGMAAVGNINFENSSFGDVQIVIQTRQNTQQVNIESCTFYNTPQNNLTMFRYRGSDGFDESINGFNISNSIFGHAKDPGGADSYAFNITQGLTETVVSVVNTYGTSDFLPNEGNSLAGLPSITYSGTSEELWVEPDSLDFNFLDQGFSGRFDTGDPRWRAD